MQASLRVYRYNAQLDKAPRYQTYSVDLSMPPDYATVLDALLKVREEVDGSLAMRCSCRSAVCGSCAMRINHHAGLACKTKLVVVAPKGEEILVEPMSNMPVIKDLVVDMNPFWNKVKAVQPWVEAKTPTPEREYLVPPERMEELQVAMNCIMCGACVSDCTVLEAELKLEKPMEKTFLGPAALAKAYRVAHDPRDSRTYKLLGMLSQPEGIWDCTHCFECVQVCPKSVAPMDRILDLRKKAMEAGFVDNNGTRHSEAFAESVKHSGWLNEVSLLLKSFGLFNISAQLKNMPGGLRMLFTGKMPSPFHKPIPGAERIKKIFEKFESKPSADSN